MGCTPVLSVRGLSVRYGRSVRALEDVDIEVGDGVLAVLGRNGAGKSTLLRAVSGTLKLHGGAITGGEILFSDPVKPGETVDLSQRPRDSEQYRQIRGGRISIIFQ